MFDAILKEYEKSKKTVEKENGKVLSSAELTICLFVYLFWSNLIEILRKEIKILSEPITKKILLGVNSVRIDSFSCYLRHYKCFFFFYWTYFVFRTCKCFTITRKSSKKKWKSSNRKSANSTRIWIHG